MDTMERHKIRGAIRDVIASLDAAPIQPDLIHEVNAVQLTNRASTAHLAIEIGLKALIRQAGEEPKDGHFLNKLYQVLKTCDAKSAQFLSQAFEDAVKFFGYNIKALGWGYFRSLEDYLAKVGTKNAYEEYRYWATGEPDITDVAIQHISLPIHRELLCALEGLFFSSRRESVSDRVEGEISNAMFGRRHISYGDEEEQKERSVKWYMNWLFRVHTTRRSALKEAVHRGFMIKDGDEFVRQTLRDAFDDLRQSRDPAVRHYVRTLTYLPKGSQPRHPDAIPIVEWLGQGQIRCMVSTPAGNCLGFIDKQADGAWAIDGLKLAMQCAESLADAKNYLVNGLTRQVTVTVNADLKRLRIVNSEDFFLPALQPPQMLEFWNSDHGLRSGDEVKAELQTDENLRFVSVLEGTVVEVAGEKVSIEGSILFDIKRSTKCDT